LITIQKSSLYALFVVLLLTTEFFWIDIFGGVARPYHFVALLLAIVHAPGILRLLKSPLVLILLMLVGVSFVAAALSDRQVFAFASLTSFLANLTVAMVVAALLARGRLSLDRMVRVVLAVSVVSVLWSLLQIMALQAGLVLALSEQQQAQIMLGFGPGFRTEANTFGKYLLFTLLFFLPALVRRPRDLRLRACYLLLLVGFFINFTRTATYGLLVGLVFAGAWYVRSGRGALLSVRIVRLIAAGMLILGLLLSGLVPISDYGRYKIENLFNRGEILTGGSSAFRLASMETVIDSAISDGRKLVIGNGWGQTQAEVQGMEVQGGGGDVVNFLGWGGLISVALYLLYTSVLWRAMHRVARRHEDPGLVQVAEGILFASVGMFVTGQLSGYLIAPEYYLLMGMAIYVELTAMGRLAGGGR
jgi:hypothetical protein